MDLEGSGGFKHRVQGLLGQQVVQEWVAVAPGLAIDN